MMQIKLGGRPFDYEPPETETPRCPCCGRECSTVFRDRYGDVFACDECVTTEDAAEAEECWPCRE